MTKIIPSKPKGGSLTLQLLVNHHFPYMRRPVMKDEIMPGVDYDYAVRLIEQDKAIVAGTQIADKVNEDGTTGEEKTIPQSIAQQLDWTGRRAVKAKDIKEDIED